MRFAPFRLLSCLFLASSALFSVHADTCAVISVPDQRLAVIENGSIVARYPVSTSRYGVGDRFNSYATPTGYLEVAGKIGQGAPLGAVFHNRRMTGEILRPNASGRDPIVTRILWLRGLETCNANAFSRNIYIHGTPVEHLIGRPASYGCVRMRSKDVVDVFNMLPVGARIDISTSSLGQAVASLESSTRVAEGATALASPSFRLAANSR